MDLTDDELIIVKDLEAQAGLFDMEVDWETLEIVAKRPLQRRIPWLERHMERNADKQMDHEFMNRDGDEKV